MSQLDELLKQRSSVRTYDNRPVEIEKLLLCIDAARQAPSARNNQPWKFIITTETTCLRKLSEAIHVPGEEVNKFVYNAPAMITVVYEDIKKPVSPNRHPHSYYYDLDHGLAIGYLLLKATELGLGTCIVGQIHDMTKLKHVLGLTEKDAVKIIITVGYSKDDYQPKKIRKSLDEIVII